MTLLTSWLASAPPDAAVQIAPESVSVAVLGSRGGEPIVSGYAIEPLPAGAVAPSLVAQNLIARPPVVDALRRALDRVGLRPRRVGLVIPDPAARVSLVPFDQVPARRDDLEQLLRWHVRKSAPFPVDDAQLTFAESRRDGGGAEFITVLARRDVVREYESVCEDLGLHPGLVDLATLSAIGLLSARSAGDSLVVHVRPGYTSVVILRRGVPIFFRTRPEGDGEPLADVVHQTTMYYQDRLGGQTFARVLLGGVEATPGALDDAWHELEERVGTTVELLDPTQEAALTDQAVATPALLATLSPLVGLLVRARSSAEAA